MASTEKVSLSLDTGSLVLARRAAVLEGMSLSAYLSRLVRRHAWESQGPVLSVEEQEAIDARTEELDEQEAADGRGGGEQRATG